MGEHRLPDVGDRAVPPVTGRRQGNGLLDVRRRIEADVARDLGILRAGDDDPADVLQALERVDGEDPVDGVEAEARTIRLEVRGAPREVVGEAAHDLVGIARDRQDALPDLRVRGMGRAVPAVGDRRRHDHGAARRTRRFREPAEVAEPGRDEGEDRVHMGEDRVRARVRHAVDEHIEPLPRLPAARREHPGDVAEQLSARRVHAAGDDFRRAPRIREERVDLEHAAAHAALQMAAHLVEDLVHPVAVHRHGHPVRRVGDLDRVVGGEPDADRLPAPVETAVVAGIDVHGEVRLGDEAVDLDGVAVLGRTPEHGYPVEVHRPVAESDLTVYVNARYNRGFNGGWKSVCVGLSTYDSIKVTHTPDGMSMSVHGNRMHEVLDEMGRHLERRVGRRVFKIDTLLADPWRPAKVVAGSVDATRRELLGDVARMFPARRGQAGERFDVLVYGVPDTSPYAVFSHVNPILTLVSSGLGYLGGLAEAAGVPGCTVIMATPVPDRWDRVTHPSYPEVWERVLPLTRDPYEIMRRFADDYARRPDYVDAYRRHFGFHPVHAIFAVYPLKRLGHVGRVIVAAPRDPAIPRHVGFDTAPNVEEAVARAAARHGRDCAIAYVRQPVLPRPS